ncbi:hypothetical protein HELRODRAFT_173114 [Helobdella robusta]|uniref:Uncharacterized protein n=1 Tax=Helobdella robusta TaxID=6412 RepID=T1F6D8_HELRO|nr:hypothetical protein HELRODRAFT_173114 [Helobdella robusta]ESO04043.1 hypothetical protein HELRODRAFT_173114 [Helobdella robusta]
MNETWCALNISILKCFVLFLLHVHHTRSDSFGSLASSYFQQLNSIAQEHLGVDKFEITQRLESRLDASVNDIDRMIELLDDKSGDIQIRLCPSSSAPGYNFNIDFFIDVNLETMCSNNVRLNSVSENFYNFVKDRYSSNYFRNKWYYTSETGPTVMYPAIVLPSTSDYRLRSSYINTISQKAKHVLLLFQSSISVTQVSDKMIMVANVILDSLSSRDRALSKSSNNKLMIVKSQQFIHYVH